MKPLREQKHKALAVLLRDFHYRYTGDTLIRKGIRGFSSESIVGRFTSILAAVEHLIPIVHDDDFYNRYNALYGVAANK